MRKKKVDGRFLLFCDDCPNVEDYIDEHTHYKIKNKVVEWQKLRI